MPQGDSAPIFVQKGFDDAAGVERLLPGPDGWVDVTISALDRLVFYLDPEAAGLVGTGASGDAVSPRRALLGRPERNPPGNFAAPAFSGFLQVGNEYRSLPVGSSFDPAGGVFAWQIGPGFLGEFKLVFVKKAGRLGTQEDPYPRPRPGPERLPGGMSARLGELWSWREFLGNMISTELKLRYRDSVLGFLWTVLNPLFFLLILAAVFSKILRVQLPNYTIFLLSGLTSWMMIQQTVVIATASIVGNQGFIKKIYVPKIVFPLASVLARYVDHLILTAVLFGFMAAYGMPANWSLLALVPVILMHFFVRLRAGPHRGRPLHPDQGRPAHHRASSSRPSSTPRRSSTPPISSRRGSR